MEQLEELKNISNNLKGKAISISITGIISLEFHVTDIWVRKST